MILEPVYLYCERTGPGVLVEPLNLAASLAFLLAAGLIWQKAQDLVLLRWMAGMTFLLFPGTVFLHMLPSPLSLGIVITGILLSMVVFFYAVNRGMMGLSRNLAVFSTLMILPFAAVSLPLIGLLPGPFSALAYLPMEILLLGYAAVLRVERPAAARGMLTSALILGAALVARAVDLPLCAVWPYGTHFVWIAGTALLSWHLAEVYRAHMLAGGGGGR